MNYMVLWVYRELEINMDIVVDKNKIPTNRKIFHVFSDNAELKRCCKCKCWKSLDLFNKSKQKWDNLKPECKKCESDYYKANKIKKNAQRLAYQRANKDIINKRRRYKRKEKNEVVCLYFRKYHKSRCKSDPLYKLSKNIRRLVQHAFKNKSLKRNSKTKDILGVDSWEQLYEHLKHTFYLNYNENYEHGKYDVHIDHIKPISLANTEEELIKLNNYKNLQFLKAEDNLAKGNSYKD